MPRLVKRLAISLTVFAALTIGGELYLRSQNYGAIPSVWFDPEIGTRFHPSQTREIYGPKMTYLSKARINAEGFRGADFDAPGVKRAQRIACLGDSFTFGWGVEDDETFPVRLAAALESGATAGQWQVLNCGMPGYNTWQELRLYEKAVRPAQPKVVVIGWYANDLDPYSIGATGTLAPTDHPLAGTAILDWYVRKFRPTKPNFQFSGLDVDAAKSLKPFYDTNRDLVEHNAGDPRARPYVERNLEHLGLLFDAIQQDGAQPVLLVFPTVGQMDALKAKRASSPEPEYLADRAIVARIQADLAAFAASRGVLSVDLLDAYMASEVRPFGSVDLSHPSVRGQQLAADALAAALEAAGLLK
ncbi:MAG: GDSL-type esterase/lipase family protein [Planctomycetota bacterium]